MIFSNELNINMHMQKIQSRMHESFWILWNLKRNSFSSEELVMV